jgi:hypothetical protein
LGRGVRLEANFSEFKQVFLNN